MRSRITAPQVTPEDARWMRWALRLAARAQGLTSPNPMVGAVVIKDGSLVGEGFHARAGAAHAEAEALARAGPAARGGTLVVSLEPCNHTGRTPPCVEAILRAGIRRVVMAVADPNPRVRGGGSVALGAAGVEVLAGCLEEEARALNRVYFTAMERGRPHVTLKCAMSLDGKIAAFDGASRWITGEDARQHGHRLRGGADAVVVGIGTALRDDPDLSVRLTPAWPREPFRVVVDSRARLPGGARLITAGTPRRAIVAVTDEAPSERVVALESRGTTMLRCKGQGGRVDLGDLLGRLSALDVTAVLIEGGSQLNASFLDAGLVDRVAFFLAPMLIGGETAPTVIGGQGRALADAIRLRSVEIHSVGPDWLIEGDVSDPGPEARLRGT